MLPFWRRQILSTLLCLLRSIRFARGSALLPIDAAGRERVIASISRPLQAEEKNYPVHDKALLAIKYALVNFSLSPWLQAIRRLNGSCIITHGDTVASPLSENGSVDFLLCGI